MQSKPNYVDMMIYFLFVKGVVELGYNTYNSGLWKWINSQSVDHDTETYNAGLWNLNWHQQQNDTDITSLDDTNQLEAKVEVGVEVETITDTPPLRSVVDGYNEDIIHTNKYDETIPDSKDSKYYSTEEVSRIALAVEGRRNGQTNYWLGNKNFIIDVSGDFVENKSPWFNSSKNGVPVEMDLDNTLDTIKPFNTTKLDTVKVYKNDDDDDKLDVVDITTPNVDLYDTIDTIDECLYKKCAEIKINKINKTCDAKIIPDHFKDIMSCNEKSAYTRKSSEYTNRKNRQTLNKSF